MKLKKKLWISLIILFLGLPIVSASVERGPNWDKDCSGNGCNIIVYSFEKNVLNNSEYIPFEDVLDYRWVASSEGWNFSGSFNNFSAWFVLKPYIQRADTGEWLDYSDIRDLFPNINITQYVQTNKGSKKFGINFTNIPQKVSDNILRIAFKVESAGNLQWSDVSLEHPCVIIKNKVRFCYNDILETTNYNISLYNKSTVLIEGMQGDTDIYLDPTISQATGEALIIQNAYLDEDQPDTNVGESANRLRIQSYTGGLNDRRSVIMINTSSIVILGSVTNAELYVNQYANWNYASDIENISAYYCNDTFNQSNITWNNLDSEVINCQLITHQAYNWSTNGWKAINVTSYVQNELGDDETFTIKFKFQKENDTDGGYSYLRSRSSVTDPPYMNITYNTAPTINSNISIPTSPEYSNETILQINVTDEDGEDTLSYCNFTVVGANGTTVINNTNGTRDGDLWNSTAFNISHGYGQYNYSATCFDGTDTVTRNWNYNLSLGTLNYTPSGTWTFSQTAGSNETKEFQLSHDGNSRNNVINVTPEGDLNNKSIVSSIIYSSNSFSVLVSDTYDINVTINFNTSAPNGTFTGNITFNITDDGSILRIPVSITLDSLSADLYMSGTSPTSMYASSTENWDLTINNTGNYNATNCSCSASGDISSFTSFSDSEFNISNGSYKTITVYYTSPTQGTYSPSDIIVTCTNATPSRGSDTYSIKTNTLTVLAAPATPTGGGGGAASEPDIIVGDINFNLRPKGYSGPKILWEFHKEESKITFEFKSDLVFSRCETSKGFTCNISSNNAMAYLLVPEDKITGTYFGNMSVYSTITSTQEAVDTVSIAVNIINLGAYIKFAPIGENYKSGGVTDYIVKIKDGKIIGIRWLPIALIIILALIVVARTYGQVRRYRR